MTTRIVRRTITALSLGGASVLVACSSVPATRSLRLGSTGSAGGIAASGQVINMTSEDTSVSVDCADEAGLALSLRSIGTNVSVDHVRGIGHLRFPGRANARAFAPLFVIDGVPLDDEFEVVIPTRSIARVDVMKDSIATQPYGWRGRRGVVLVTLRAR